MRIVFLGTPDFAVPALRRLLAAGRDQYDVKAVITQPDRPAGRGLKPTPSPVKVLAEEAGIPVFQPERIRRDPNIKETLADLDPELMVVVAFGQILPADFFGYPRFGTLNIHASLLPKYRGAAPIARAILNGEKQTGVTIMKIDEGMDTGDILSQRAVTVGNETTAGELEAILAVEGADLLLETIPGYVSGALVPCPQDHSLASYAPPLRKEESPIEWIKNAAALHNQIRAMNPWPVASSSLRDQPVKIWRSVLGPVGVESGKIGEILAISAVGITVQCGEGSSLCLTEIQLPGRKRLRAFDVANGLKLKVGEVFGP
mgnify:CR=1 FL=1